MNKMERFERAMNRAGVPETTIQLVKDSPVWNQRIRNYTQEDMNVMIDIFPKVYLTIHPNSSFYSSPSEFEKARKQYAPMDLSD